jgi:hypothetical protein
MIKKHVLAAIENVIEYHTEQMEKIEQLVNGESVKKLAPVSKFDCEFGKWIYGDAQRIQTVLGIQFYENVTVMHEYWHIEYGKIHDIFYDDEESGLLSKIFGNRRKVTAKELAQARGDYKKLTRTSDDILEALTASKRRVLALKNESFKDID